jgi:hypothetical protein
MNTATFLPAVRDYAQAVRAALTGLDAQQVHELTEDLETDLVDALADGSDSAETPDDAPASQDAGDDPTAAAPAAHDGTPMTLAQMVARFGPAERYADDLRAGAGLPPRVEGGAPTGGDTPGDRVAGEDPLAAPEPAQDGSVAEARPAGAEAPAVLRPPKIREFWQAARRRWGQRWWWLALAWLGRVLRPLWWVTRGLVVVALFYQAIYERLGMFSVMLAFCAAVGGSLAAGRVDWRAAPKAARVLMAVANTVLAWGVVIWIGGTSVMYPALDPRFSDSSNVESPEMVVTWDCAQGASALCFDGQPLTNVFAFDADGEPLENVQLFDPSGRPLTVRAPEGADPNNWMWETADLYSKDSRGDIYVIAPAQDADGRPLWNVFPLASHLWRFDDDTGRWEQVDAAGAATVQPFMGRTDLVDPSSLPGASDEEAGAGESPAPSASPPSTTAE